MATTTASPLSDSAEPRVDSLLVVLCHGLLGTAGQMAAMGGLVADALAAAVPALDVHVLCSRTNQSLWGVGLLAGGARLAREITAEAAAVWPCARTVGLVGIGHSLGGLYLRAALPHLRLAGETRGQLTPQLRTQQEQRTPQVQQEQQQWQQQKPPSAGERRKPRRLCR